MKNQVEEQKTRVDNLTTQNAAQEKDISDLITKNTAQAESISTLQTNAQTQADEITELKQARDDGAAEVQRARDDAAADLKKSEDKAASRFAELEAQIARLTLQAERVDYMNSLTTQITETTERLRAELNQPEAQPHDPAPAAAAEEAVNGVQSPRLSVAENVEVVSHGPSVSQAPNKETYMFNHCIELVNLEKANKAMREILKSAGIDDPTVPVADASPRSPSGETIRAKSDSSYDSREWPLVSDTKEEVDKLNEELAQARKDNQELKALVEQIKEGTRNNPTDTTGEGTPLPSNVQPATQTQTQPQSNASTQHNKTDKTCVLA